MKEPVELAIFEGKGRALQISEGNTGKIEVNRSMVIKDGKYTTATLTFQNVVRVKAWAYLDADNDGAIDTTIWTTTPGIQKSATRLTTESQMTGYDYYKYPWAMPLIATNTTDNSQFGYGVTTFFKTPVVVKEGQVTVNDKTSDTPDLDLLIDTYNLVKVWDGRYGNSMLEEVILGRPIHYGSGQLRLPPPVMPFPQGDDDSRTGGGGVQMKAFYPAGKPPLP